jgi:hypothetical protein
MSARSLIAALLLAVGLVAGSPAQTGHSGAGQADPAAPESDVRPRRGPMGRMAGPLGNPGNPVMQFLRMSPEEREKALANLPPRRRMRIRQALENFDRLPQAEKERRLRLLDEFRQLPAERQQLLNERIQAFNSLPIRRRLWLRPELMRLRRMSPEDRQVRLNSPEFKARFDPSEQQILIDLAEFYPFPAR